MKTILLVSALAVTLYSCSWLDNNKVNAATTTISGLDTSLAIPLSPEAKKYSPRIKAFMDSSFKAGTLNGSILIAKNGELIYERHEGFERYRSKKDSIQKNSPFHLASVSKTLTATGILKLCQEGKLKIEDPVANYLAGFPLPDITIKTLLNHRSGLPNYVHYMERLGWDRKKRITNQDVLDFLVTRHDEIDIRRADRGFSYSNTNYALLALIIEKTSGLSYPEYMKKTFFEPLGMNDSYVFSIADSARSMPSYYYGGRQYAFDYLDLVYGDKNIYSTTNDLLKFDRALYDDNFLGKNLLEAAYSAYSFEKPGTHNYGLGWRMLLLKNGKKIIYHNGWWHGNRTAYYRLIDEKVTIIALCNNDSKRIYSVKKLADLFGPYLQTGDKDDDGEGQGLVQNTRKTNSTSLNDSDQGANQPINKSLATKK